MVPSRVMRRFLLSAIALVVAACGSPDAAQRQAAVAMPDSYSAEVASAILERGGNAVDAAIAAAFSLAVTLPEAGNIGGGGFMLVHFDGASDFVDYREAAPLAAHRDLYLDGNGDVIPFSSLAGHRAAGVPGTVAGMWLAHQRYGSMPWETLVQPAVDLARNGFVVHEQLAARAAETTEWYQDYLDFEANFGTLVAGEVFVQPDLARTLERIAEQGPDDFYRGETADLIVAEMDRGGGLITHEDLERYRAIVRKPLVAKWRGLQVISAPPPSSGGFAVIQLLKIKDFLAHEFDAVAHNSPQYIHLVAEIEKRVFADRAEYLGDPDYVDVPIEELVSDAYIKRRALEVNPTDISTLDALAPGLESPDTTHFSILDKDGNAVSNTYTLNMDFGSGVVVGGAGFLLNDQMDDFSAKPGVKNAFGVVGSTANEIQPGKRMLSSMSPTLILNGDDVELVVGTPGGSTIFTTVFQVVINIYDFEMTAAQAAAASRFHHQLMPPDLITYSPGVPLSEETVSGLGEKGYVAKPHSWPFGDVQVIKRQGDQLDVASDPRKRGEARVLDY